MNIVVLDTISHIEVKSRYNSNLKLINYYINNN